MLDSASGPSSATRFAVLFRTHTWDDFVERQYQRVLARVQGGDVFILANNTTGSCDNIPHKAAIKFTEDNLLAMGLARAGENNLLWYNVDYPLYYFCKIRPDYSHIALIEFDVVLNIMVDKVIEYCIKKDVDLIGLTLDPSLDEWVWTYTCSDHYDIKDIRKFLLPFGVFTQRAVTHLFGKRLEHSREFQRKTSSRWPHCEAFIPTELALAGFKLAELSELGRTQRFNFRPTTYEADLPSLQDEAFIHPVLDKTRYIQSVLKYSVRTESYFLPGSPIGAGLRRFPVADYRRYLLDALFKRVNYLARNPAAILRRFRGTPSWKRL